MSWLGYSWARASCIPTTTARSANAPATSSRFVPITCICSSRRSGQAKRRPDTFRFSARRRWVFPTQPVPGAVSSAHRLDLGYADVLAPILDGGLEQLLGLLRRVDERVAAERVEERLGLVR